MKSIKNILKNRFLLFVFFLPLTISLIVFIALRTKGEQAPVYSDIILKEANVKRIENRVKRNQTFSDILKGYSVEWESIILILKNSKGVYDFSKIKKGDKYEIVLKNDKFYGFIYHISPEKYVLILRNGKEIETRLIKKRVKTVFYSKKITVYDSLYNAMIRAGEKPFLAEKIAGIFEYDIDFNREIRRGDTFIVLFEKKYIEDDFYSYGKILYAKAFVKGREIEAIRFKNEAGREEFYQPDGRAMRKMFVKSPLPFFVVTSRFGMRFHPILGFSAKHNGVDLRAPVGTPVRATADGIVWRIGYERYKGRYIILKHKNGYKTHYYHLSRFGKGIRRFKRVKQKQIIGYTGNTGLSTGPHLHYGISKYGKFLNPLRFSSPSLKPLPNKKLPELLKKREKYLRILEKKQGSL